MDHTAGDGAEFAVVGIHVQAEKLVFAWGRAFRDVEDEGRWSLDDQAGSIAGDVAVHIAFDDAYAGNVLERSAGFEVDDLGGHFLPGTAGVLVVDANAVDTCGDTEGLAGVAAAGIST